MKAVRDDGPDATLVQWNAEDLGMLNGLLDAADSYLPSDEPVFGVVNGQLWKADPDEQSEQIKLVTKTAREQCKHETPTMLRKNRFRCEACGYEYRMVKQSVLKRGLYLRSARSLHRGK